MQMQKNSFCKVVAADIIDFFIIGLLSLCALIGYYFSQFKIFFSEFNIYFPEKIFDFFYDNINILQSLFLFSFVAAITYNIFCLNIFKNTLGNMLCNISMSFKKHKTFSTLLLLAAIRGTLSFIFFILCGVSIFYAWFIDKNHRSLTDRILALL